MALDGGADQAKTATQIRLSLRLLGITHQKLKQVIEGRHDLTANKIAYAKTPLDSRVGTKIMIAFPFAAGLISRRFGFLAPSPTLLACSRDTLLRGCHWSQNFGSERRAQTGSTLEHRQQASQQRQRDVIYVIA
jgi:hypothetical protein